MFVTLAPTAHRLTLMTLGARLPSNLGNYMAWLFEKGYEGIGLVFS